MGNFNTFVGIDAHKEKHAIGVALAGRAKAEFLHEIGSDLRSVERMLSKYEKETTLFCYEAGPTGYGLQRYLSSKGYECQVVAPSLVPKKAGEKIKTNRRDAIKLAGLLRSGELTEIYIPNEAQEAVRDLTRAREDAKNAEKKAKLNLGSFLLRHGKLNSSGKWTKGYYTWLRGLKFSFVHQQVVFEDYIQAVINCSERVARLEDQMRHLYESWEFRWLCDGLMALRGVSLITAMSTIAEIGDMRRFQSAREFMAYLGLVPTESTTGNQVSRGSITKAGNSHVRRLLVESAWSYRLPPRRSAHWWRRAKNTSKPVQEIAWKAMIRLNQRYWKLTARKVPSQKIIIAVARELAGFIWSVAQHCHAEQLICQKAA